MKEYWVNVYKDGYGYLNDPQIYVYNNQKWKTREKAIEWSNWTIMKTVYRIHVKMKPVNITPDCDKPDEVAKAYEMSRNFMDSYRAGY